MMCNEVKKYLDTYVDEELEASTMLSVGNHIESCAGCAALASLKKRFKREIRNLGQVEAPFHLRQQIMHLAVRQRRRRFWAPWVAAPMAAAAAVIIALSWPTTKLDSDPLATYLNDVVESHSRDLPMEIKGPDPSQAASWFKGKVDFPLQAGALKLKSASFEGARLSNVRAEPAAHMVYHVNGHRVTLMIFNTRGLHLDAARRVAVGNKEVLLTKQHGYNIAAILDSDMAYVLSSDLSQDQLLDLARSFVQ